MNNLKLLNDARHAARDIRRAVASNLYKPNELRFNIDFLRDAIIKLASNLEFGYVAELSETSKRLLDTHSRETNSRTEKISMDDMLYIINTFPCAPSGIDKYISNEFNFNSQIIDATIRSGNQLNHNYIADNFYIILRLSELGDLASWIKLSKSMLENAGQTDLVLRTFSNFSTELIKNSHEELEFISEAAREFNPSHFPNEYMGEKLDFENLLYNLKAAGASEVARNLLKCGNGSFVREFTLQRYIHDFGFQPNEVYRRNAARFSTSPHYDSSKKHLASSFFAYELSTAEPLCRIDNTPKPSLLKKILELDEFESPYGVIRLNPEKVATFVDETLRMSLKDHKGDWDKVIKDYREIDEKVLMKSKIYKTKSLETDLGI